MSRQTEERSHTFVVHLWVEGRDADGDPVWHSYVAHVLDDDRERPHATDGIDAIASHLARYLADLGVPPEKMGWTRRP